MWWREGGERVENGTLLIIGIADQPRFRASAYLAAHVLPNFSFRIWRPRARKPCGRGGEKYLAQNGPGGKGGEGTGRRQRRVADRGVRGRGTGWIVPPRRPEMGIFQALSVGHTGVRYLRSLYRSSSLSGAVAAVRRGGCGRKGQSGESRALE